MTEPDWLALNRANWDERVAAHLAPESDYDLSGLRAGHHALHGIEECELGPVKGLRLLHLQCHFGLDTLALAQRGAEVTGVDFSGPAIEAAQGLAKELGLAANFVRSDIYAARQVLSGDFDGVFTTWGTIPWLPDIAGWARVIASLLKPGGFLYFADMHPAAMVFDDEAGMACGQVGSGRISTRAFSRSTTRGTMPIPRRCYDTARRTISCIRSATWCRR